MAIGAVLLWSSMAGSAAAGKPVDIEAAQAIIAVQELDGWLLCSVKDGNPVAIDVAAPQGAVGKTWFYFIPADGQPSLLIHKSDEARFTDVVGKKLTYSGTRDLKTGLRQLLKGAKRVAMEYAPKSGIPSLTRVDEATVKTVTSLGVTVTSSAELVQFTKSLWGPKGRVAHYVAAHHLSKLRQEALAFIARKVKAKESITEQDVQQLLVRGLKQRGLAGKPPVVAVGEHTADPQYSPRKGGGIEIKEGDLVVIELAAHLERGERPIYAAQSWVAYVGADVPERFTRVFKAVAKARDETIDFIDDRVSRRKQVSGSEADQRARAVIGEAGFADRFVHRTGHSLDTSFEGDGANLDSFETNDSRALVQDSGFTIGPGVYVAGDFGIVSEVSVYVGRKGLEVTTPVQDAITPILRGSK